jgi:hypothetical protein
MTAEKRGFYPKNSEERKISKKCLHGTIGILSQLFVISCSLPFHVAPDIAMVSELHPSLVATFIYTINISLTNVV